jgi:hypothetical protein
MSNYLDRLYGKFVVSLIIKHSQGLFRSTLRNCVRLDGSISSKRTWGEIKRLLKFGVVLLIIPLSFIAVNGMAVYFVHNYIIPIPIATDIFSVFNIDPLEWENSIENEALGDVGAQYEEWSRKKGFSPQSARFWQETLWHNWVFFTLFALYLVGTFYFFVVKMCSAVIIYHRKGLFRRKEIYYNMDLTTIPEHRMIY